MPRTGTFIHQVHIADGFADDCDELVHRCMKVENLNYQVFCSIWKQMNMGCLYEGRILGAEIAELSEEVIHIAKHYMLKNTENFEESVAGLFIVYALLNLQPYPGFAHLRIVPADVPAIDRLELVARREKRHDVLYALGAVLVRGAVQYHVAEREHGMDLAIRKYLEGYTSIDRLGVRPKGVFYRQNEELDIIRELNSITERYTLAKMAISETVEFNRNLKYINENLSSELQGSLKKIISGIYEEHTVNLDKNNDVSEDKILKSRQAIKNKAMKRDVDPVKHLMNAEERKKMAAKKGKSRRAAKAKASENSATKIQPKQEPLNRITDLEKKRRIPISPRAIKRCRNAEASKESTSESETSEEDEEVDEDSDSDEDSGSSDSENDEKDNDKEDDDNNIDSKPVVPLEKPKTATNNEATVNIEEDKTQQVETEIIGKENEQELDIEIDTLPVFIRTEDQGKLYEIEIIDSMKDRQKEVRPEPVQHVRTPAKELNALKKISLMPGLSIMKIDASKQVDEPSNTDAVANEGTTIDDLANITEINKESPTKDDVFKKPEWPGIPRVEKRNMKRVHLQSKFKKLGMLPVANFEPTDQVEEDEQDAEPMASVSNRDLDVIED